MADGTTVKARAESQKGYRFEKKGTNQSTKFITFRGCLGDSGERCFEQGVEPGFGVVGKQGTQEKLVEPGSDKESFIVSGERRVTGDKFGVAQGGEPTRLGQIDGDFGASE